MYCVKNMSNYSIDYSVVLYVYVDAGHAYNAATSVECNQISTDETNLMRKYIELFDKRIKYSASNNGKSALSVGCTLTELARTDYCRVSEIRPGNYVFMDLTPLRIGLIERHDISLSILATVISMNEKYALVGKSLPDWVEIARFAFINF